MIYWTAIKYYTFLLYLYIPWLKYCNKFLTHFFFSFAHIWTFYHNYTENQLFFLPSLQKSYLKSLWTVKKSLCSINYIWNLVTTYTISSYQSINSQNIPIQSIQKLKSDFYFRRFKTVESTAKKIYKVKLKFFLT